MKIWVVAGSTGEYSDHMEWYVCYYTDESLAKLHAELAGAEAREISKERPNRFDLEGARKNPYDPGMIMDYTGTNYYIFEVEPGWIKSQ